MSKNQAELTAALGINNFVGGEIISQGNLHLVARDGDISNRGKIKSEKSDIFLNSSRDIENWQSVYSTGKLHIKSGRNVSNVGAIKSVGLDIYSIAGDITNSGDIVSLAESTMNAHAVIHNTGNIVSANKLKMNAAELINTSVPGVALDRSGNIISQAEADIIIVGNIVNTNRIMSQAKLTIISTTGEITNQNAKIISGDEVDITAVRGINNKDGTIESANDLTLKSTGVESVLDNIGGNIISGQKLTSTIVGDIKNSMGGSIKSLGDLSLISVAGKIVETAGGTISAGGLATIKVNGEIVNDGIMQAQGNLTVESETGQITNNSNMLSLVATNVKAFREVMNAVGAKIESGSIVAIKGSAISNLGEVRSSGGDTTFLAVEDITNSGLISATGALNLAGHHFMNHANGIVNVKGGNSIINLTGNIENHGEVHLVNVSELNALNFTNNKIFQVTGNVAKGTIVGAFVNKDQAEIAGNLTIGGKFANSGKLQFKKRDLSLAAASYDNTSTGVLVGSNFNLVSIGAVTNSGDVFAENSISLTAIGQTITNTGNIIAVGNVTTNSQALQNSKSISGANLVKITGATTVTNTGTIDSANNINITAPTVTNNANIIAGLDVTITGNTLIANSGTIRSYKTANLNGGSLTTTTLEVKNKLTTSLSGDLTNNGNIYAGDMDLKLDGSLNNTQHHQIISKRGIKVSNKVGGRVVLVTNRGGTISAEGGDITIRANGMNQRASISETRILGVLEKERNRLNARIGGGRSVGWGGFFKKSRAGKTSWDGVQISITPYEVIGGDWVNDRRIDTKKYRDTFEESNAATLSAKDNITLDVGYVDSTGSYISGAQYLGPSNSNDVILKNYELYFPNERWRTYETVDVSDDLGSAFGDTKEQETTHYAARPIENIKSTIDKTITANIQASGNITIRSNASDIFGKDYASDQTTAAAKIAKDAEIAKAPLNNPNLTSNTPLHPTQIIPVVPVTQQNPETAALMAQAPPGTRNPEITWKPAKSQVDTIRKGLAAIETPDLVQRMLELAAHYPARPKIQRISQEEVDSFNDPDITAIVNAASWMPPEAPDKYWIPETNPFLTDISKYQGTEDFIERIQRNSSNFNPKKEAKHFGNSFQQMQLIQRQIIDLTGLSLLSGHVDIAEQIRSLYDSAEKHISKHGLIPGIPPTQAQKDALEEDMVWPELMHVNGSWVMTPVVYLAQSKTDQKFSGLKAGGAVDIKLDKYKNTAQIEGQHVRIETTEGNLESSGSVKATKTLSTISAANTINTGLFEAGTNLSMVSVENTDNIGGQLLSHGNAQIQAGGSFRNITETQRHGSGENYYDTKGPTGEVLVDGNLHVQTGEDYVNIASTTKAGSLDAHIGRDFVTTAAEQSNASANYFDGGYSKEEHHDYVPSVFEVKQSAKAHVLGDFSLVGSVFKTGENFEAEVGGNSYITSLLKMGHLEGASSHESDGFMGIGSNESTSSYMNHHEQVIDAGIESGGSTHLINKEDQTFVGARMLSKNGTKLSARRMKLLAQSSSTGNSSASSEKGTFWQSAEGEGRMDQTTHETTFTGPVQLDAREGIEAEVDRGGTSSHQGGLFGGLSLPKYSDHKDAGLEKLLADRTDVTFTDKSSKSESYDYEQSGLTQAGAILVGGVVTIATMGAASSIGAGLAGTGAATTAAAAPIMTVSTTSAAMATGATISTTAVATTAAVTIVPATTLGATMIGGAVSAGITTTASALTIGAINGQLDGKAFGKNLLVSMATGGITSGLTQAAGLSDLSKLQGIDRASGIVQKVGISTAVGTAVDMAVHGKTSKDVLGRFATSTALALGQNAIGDVAVAHGLDEGSIAKTAMHAAVGGAFGGTGGAIGGVVSEQMSAHFIDTKDAAGGAKIGLAAATATMLTGGDVRDMGRASATATSAFENNMRLHQDVQFAVEEYLEDKSPEEQRDIIQYMMYKKKASASVEPDDPYYAENFNGEVQGSKFDQKGRENLHQFLSSKGMPDALEYTTSDGVSDLISRNDKELTYGVGALKVGVGSAWITSTGGWGALLGGGALIVDGSSQISSDYRYTEGKKVLDSYRQPVKSYIREGGEAVAVDAGITVAGGFVAKGFGWGLGGLAKTSYGKKVMTKGYELMEDAGGFVSTKVGSMFKPTGAAQSVPASVGGVFYDVIDAASTKSAKGGLVVKANAKTKNVVQSERNGSSVDASYVDHANKGLYNSHDVKAALESKYPGQVTSSTVPNLSQKNVKLAGQKHPKADVVFDLKGFPIFDKHVKYDTKVPRSIGSKDNGIADMRAATRDLRQKIQSGKLDSGLFDDIQIKDIKAGKAKIKGYTWHHHQDKDRIQLVPDNIHKKTGHIGGMEMND